MPATRAALTAARRVSDQEPSASIGGPGKPEVRRAPRRGDAAASVGAAGRRASPIAAAVSPATHSRATRVQTRSNGPKDETPRDFAANW